MARYVNLDKIEAQLMQMYKCVPFAVKQIFDEAEVEEVVSVEQVANFLLKFLDDPFPCNFVWFEERMVEDEWCAENCQIYMKENVGNRCWLHAIKAGWLDETS